MKLTSLFLVPAIFISFNSGCVSKDYFSFTSAVKETVESDEVSFLGGDISLPKDVVYFNTTKASSTNINLHLYDFTDSYSFTHDQYRSTVVVDENFSSSTLVKETKPIDTYQYDTFPYTNPKSELSSTDNRIFLEHSANFRRGSTVTIQNGMFNGSGFFIRENLIFTCAHLFFDYQTPIMYKPTICVNMHGNTQTYSYEGMEVLIPELFDYKTDNANSKYDWALIKLDGNYGTTIGTLGYISNYSFKDAEISNVGYFNPSKDESIDETELYSASSKGCYTENSNIAETYSYIDHGMSGGPVIAYKDNLPYVVGVNSAIGERSSGILWFKKTGPVAVVTKITESVNEAIRFLEMND